MPKHLGSTVRALTLVGLLGPALAGCHEDAFATAYSAHRAEVINQTTSRFGPGRLAGLPWSPPRQLPTAAAGVPAATTKASPATTRGADVQVLDPIEYAGRGLTGQVYPGAGTTMDQVVEDYELAFPAGQNDPAFLNDYATALLHRGLPRDLILGGEYAARARNSAEEDDPNGELAQAARFNWALALERLALHGQATLAWQDVLDHESDSAWQAEAAAHADDLAQWPVVRWPAARERLRQAAAQGDVATVAAIFPEFRTAARLLAEDEELKTWAETAERDPIQAAEALAVARTIGTVLADHGDEFLADIVAAIDGAAGDVKKTHELASAMRGFFEGLELYKERDFEAASVSLLASDERLTSLDSPLALRASFLALVSSAERSLGEILDWSDDLLAARVPDRYPLLRAQIAYARGWLRCRAGFVEGSLRNLEQAVEDSRALSEEVATWFASMFGAALELAHDPRADVVDRQWLSSASRVATPYGRYFLAYAVYYRAVEAVQLSPAVGKAAVLEAADQIESTTQAVEAAETGTDLYRSALEAGDFDAALRYRRRVEAEIARIRSPESLRYSLGMLDWAVAKNPRATPLARERALESALRQFSDGGIESPAEIPQLAPSRKFAVHQLSLLRDLAEGKLAEGHGEEAAEYASKALEMIAARVASDRPRSGGHGLAGEVRPLLQTQLQAELERGTPAAQLFDRIEWALHLAAPGLTAPRTAAQVLEGLSADTVLVELMPVGDRLLAFRFGHGVASPMTFDLRVPSLAARAACLGPRDRNPGICGTSWDDDAALFARDAVEPWLCSIPRGTRLVLVPGPLIGVPFAGLPIRCAQEVEGRLVDRHVPSLGASATSYLEGHARARELAGRNPPASVLAIGVRNAVDAPTLDFAAEEARAVAGSYPNPVLLLDAAATREAALAGLHGVDVVHFATHGEVDGGQPAGSFLALAKGRLRFGDLASQASAIASLRLAVLAACDTGGGLRGIEGLIGMSRAFLDRGVPTVVATLSSVEDRASLALMTEFHRRYRATGDAAQALAEVQRAVAGHGSEREAEIEQQNPPEWAKWVVVGG